MIEKNNLTKRQLDTLTYKNLDMSNTGEPGPRVRSDKALENAIKKADHPIANVVGAMETSGILGIVARLVWRHKECDDAHEYLLDMIRFLGSQQKKNPKGDDAIGAAVEKLRTLSGADQAHVYVWDRHWSVVRPICPTEVTDKFRFPSFACGSIIRNSTPRKLILKSSSPEPESVFVIGHDDLLLSEEGSYCNREQIVESLAVLLRPASENAYYRTHRILVFLNYKQDTLDSLRGDVSVQNYLGEQAKSLEMSVRQLNGWLERRSAVIEPLKRWLHPVKACEAIHGLAHFNCAGDRSTWLAGTNNELRNIVSRLFTPDTPSAEFPGVTLSILGEDRNSITLYNADHQDGEHHELNVCDDGMIKDNQSLSGQVCLWNRPVLMKVDATVGSTESHKREQAIRCTYGDDLQEAVCEAVVPISQDRETVLGAISVCQFSESERAHNLNTSSLLLLEYIGVTVGALHALRNEKSDQLSSFIHLLDSFPEFKGRVEQYGDPNAARLASDWLMNAMCHWLRWITASDMVYVLLADPGAKLCHPRGLSAHSEICRSFAAHLGYDNTMDNRFTEIDEAVNTQVPADTWLFDLMRAHTNVNDQYSPIRLEPDGAQERLFLASLALPLAPRSNGRSWDVFVQGESFDSTKKNQVNDPSSERIAHLLLMEKMSSRYAIALKCQPDADPIGAIWFARLTNNGGTQSHSAAEDAQRRRSYCNNNTRKFVDLVTHAVAGLCSICAASQ